MQPFFVYTPWHVFWETNVVILSQLLSNLGEALVGVFVISAILLIHPIAVAIIVAAVLTVDLGLIGEMWILGLPLNTVSVVNLVVRLQCFLRTT